MIRNYNIESYNGQSFEEYEKDLQCGIKTNQNKGKYNKNAFYKRFCIIIKK